MGGVCGQIRSIYCRLVCLMPDGCDCHEAALGCSPQIQSPYAVQALGWD